ncbi:hypothetical protein [Gilvimarinus polysaccharolyticus]|uniref:hypothetical protein n=1 Tax=Gilvimarinus polysaccharolyticus TaxID=863921 RepID=UPI0006731E41|nr:hypothetical protein [Gilvimarinus polysaccharolyticus]
MFNFTNRSSLQTFIAGLTIVFAAGAHAADRKVPGVVESVDLATKSVSIIADKTGEKLTYRFNGTPKVRIGGYTSHDVANLQTGQHVTLKLSSIAPKKAKSRVIAGEILELDLQQNVALIRPADGSAPRTIALPDAIRVSGLHKGAGIEDLQEGQQVTFKYAPQ